MKAATAVAVLILSFKYSDMRYLPESAVAIPNFETIHTLDQSPLK